MSSHKAKALKKVGSKKEYTPKWARKGYLSDPYGPKGEKKGMK